MIIGFLVEFWYLLEIRVVIWIIAVRNLVDAILVFRFFLDFFVYLLHDLNVLILRLSKLLGHVVSNLKYLITQK